MKHYSWSEVCCSSRNVIITCNEAFITRVTSMTTEYFVVYDGGYRETVETVCEGLSQFDAVPPLACMVRERGRRERERDRETNTTMQELY